MVTFNKELQRSGIGISLLVFLAAVLPETIPLLPS